MMTEKNIVTKIQVCSFNDLNEEDKKLVELAKNATRSSYTPYSGFNVGAAILLENGMMIKGANQENAAFAGTCAERSACYNAGANYPGVRFVKVAVTAHTKGEFVTEPCAPCGVCRQALLEFEVQAGRPIEVLLIGRDEIIRLPSVSSLLPLAFSKF